ncbi:unnamed protein product [Arctia plantaginis]|uniref:Uncharacterized protein n=1 Tax=Arctia plantaginis TaxID=874455 RepID=A0A8S1A205_ARCPL|nr:unnamed protein product [Arctia plantaginis]
MNTVGVSARRGESGAGLHYIIASAGHDRSRREQSRPHGAGVAGSDLDASRGMNHGSESGRNVLPRPAPLTFTFQCGATDCGLAERARHSPGARGPQRRRADPHTALPILTARACDCARITVKQPHSASHTIQFE